MGQLAGILNIFGFVAVLAITACVFVLWYFGVIELNRLKSMLTFISRNGIFITGEDIKELYHGAFTYKEMLLMVQLQDHHLRDENGKPIGKQYGFVDMETEDTRNINLFTAKFVSEKTY